VSSAGKFAGIEEGKGLGTPRRLFVIVAEGAILFTVAAWALVLALGLVIPRAFTPDKSTHSEIIGTLLAVIVPDSLATWWIFRRLRTDRSRNDARRAATAFAVSAPVTLGFGSLLGELVGGYAEAWLGSWFILPAVVAFMFIVMIVVPSGVVMWALHPSGGGEPVSGSESR